MVAYINKEGGDEIGPSVCPSVENSNLVYQQTGYPQSLTHPRSAERGSRQAIEARPDNSNRVVSPSRNLQGHMQQVAPTPNRPFCTRFNKLVQFVSPVPDPQSGAVDAPSSCLWQNGGETTQLSMQENHSHCPGVAQHALVLGSSGHVQLNSTEPTLPVQPAHTAIQSDSKQES